MKSKSLLVLVLALFVSLIVTYNCSAEPPGDSVQSEDLVVNLIAQNTAAQDVNNAIPSQNLYAPVPLSGLEKSAFEQYGIVGFVVVASMGLVVFVVRADRKSLGDLADSINKQSEAIMKLAKTHESEMQKIHLQLDGKMDNMLSRVENIERKMDNRASPNA